MKRQREEKYIQIITELNKQRRQGENQIFDCGELGLIHIWWQGHQWRSEWVIPSKEFKILVTRKEEDK